MHSNESADVWPAGAFWLLLHNARLKAVIGSASDEDAAMCALELLSCKSLRIWTDEDEDVVLETLFAI